MCALQKVKLDVTTRQGKRTGQLYLEIQFDSLTDAKGLGKTAERHRTKAGRGCGCCGSRPTGPREAPKTRNAAKLRAARQAGVEYVEPERKDPFFDTVHKTVGEMYEIVGKGMNDKISLYKELGQMRLIVLARRDVLPLISAMEITTEATGIGGIVANKGGIVAKFVLQGVSLCFVCSHLAAHEGLRHCEERNGHAEEIQRNG